VMSIVEAVVCGWSQSGGGRVVVVVVVGMVHIVALKGRAAAVRTAVRTRGVNPRAPRDNNTHTPGQMLGVDISGLERAFMLGVRGGDRRPALIFLFCILFYFSQIQVRITTATRAWLPP